MSGTNNEWTVSIGRRAGDKWAAFCGSLVEIEAPVHPGHADIARILRTAAEHYDGRAEWTPPRSTTLDGEEVVVVSERPDDSV